MLSSKVGAIEFDGDEVRVAVVKTGGRLPTVLDLQRCRAEYEDPEERFDAMVAAVDTAVGRLRTRPAAYVLCANCMNSIARTIGIPMRGRRRVLAAARFELEPYLAFPIEELLVDFSIVGEFEGETEVLAMGIRRKHIEEQEAILAEAGIVVEAVGLDVIALTGLWRRRRKVRKGLRAVLHMREKSACLVILHNRTVAYFRGLSCTAAQLGERPETVARDVKNTIRAFLAKWRGGGEIERLDVTGVAFTPEASAAFSKAVGMAVVGDVMLEVLRGAGRALKAASDPASGEASADAPVSNVWEAVIGAGFGAGGAVCAVDFKRSEGDWGGMVRGAAAHLMFTCCLVMLALLGGAFYFHQGALANGEACAALQGQIDELSRELEEISGKGLEEDFDLASFSDPLLLDVLREIGSKMPEKSVSIDSIKLSTPGSRTGWVTIEGRTQEAGGFNDVLDGLAESSLFRVEMNPNLRLTGDTTNFTVKAFRNEEDQDETDST